MKRGSSLTRRSPLSSRQALATGSTLRRVPFKRPARLEEPARSTLRSVSPKRRGQLAQYRVLRAEFLATRPTCEHPSGCLNPTTEVQHRRGRRGERLLDVAWWAASCHRCNADAETATLAALECGWLVLIEGAE